MPRERVGTVEGFGERLQELMWKHNLSDGDVGKRISRNRKTVLAYRHGDGMPDGVILVRLCDALRTTPNYLLLGRE